VFDVLVPTLVAPEEATERSRAEPRPERFQERSPPLVLSLVPLLSLLSSLLALLALLRFAAGLTLTLTPPQTRVQKPP